jgi:acyl-CoA synthetase (AMP-forming)/AMP-acid ligase II
MINHSDSRALIFSNEFSDTVKKVIPSLPKDFLYISFGGTDLSAAYSYEELIETSSINPPDIEVSGTDLFAIMYTAGTTGRPKGVMFSHNSRVLNSLKAIECGLNETSILATMSPMYHVAGGHTMFLSCMITGATIVLSRAFIEKEFVELLEREKVTILYIVPVLIRRLINYLKSCERRYDLSSLRAIWFGAEICPEEYKRELMKMFPNVELVDMYGLTEGGPLSGTRYSLSRHGPRKTQSIGLPFIGSEFKVVDESGREVRPGEIGEILVRGVGVMEGYYKDPEKTRQTVTDDGWIRTGDLGTYDEDGFLYIVGRKDDMIISGGENIYPREIEDVLLKHPKVHEVAVVGVKDELWGERPVAFIVPKQGEKLSEDEIMEFARERLAGYKRPKFVRIVDSLPKSDAGKVLRRELRKMIQEGRL